MTDRAAELCRLVHSLEELVAILRRDSTCPLAQGFEELLGDARSLESDGFAKDDLSTLSVSVMSVFGGMGSFNDYVPYVDTRVAPWVNELDEVRRRVYENAIHLRVISDADQ